MATKTDNKSTSRSVSFDTRTKVFLVESLADFTDEINAVWTTPEENKTSLTDVAKNAKAMRGNDTEDDSLGLWNR